jgi:phosphoenolpyruvate synthase/pyruvate phosphate dikinase
MISLKELERQMMEVDKNQREHLEKIYNERQERLNKNIADKTKQVNDNLFNSNYAQAALKIFK